MLDNRIGSFAADPAASARTSSPLAPVPGDFRASYHRRGAVIEINPSAVAVGALMTAGAKSESAVIADFAVFNNDIGISGVNSAAVAAEAVSNHRVGKGDVGVVAEDAASGAVAGIAVGDYAVVENGAAGAGGREADSAPSVRLYRLVGDEPDRACLGSGCL